MKQSQIFSPKVIFLLRLHQFLGTIIKCMACGMSIIAAIIPLNFIARHNKVKEGIGNLMVHFHWANAKVKVNNCCWLENCFYSYWANLCLKATIFLFVGLHFTFRNFKVRWSRKKIKIELGFKMHDMFIGIISVSNMLWNFI